MKLIIDTQTGYFNATKLCASGGRRYYNWLKNKAAKECIQYLKVKLNEVILYEHKGGTRRKLHLSVRGAYASRHLITNIASWISTEFAFQVNEIVTDYFIRDFKEKCESNEIKIKKCEHEKEDISPQIRNPAKRYVFILVKTGGVYPYYVIRCQRRSKSTQVKKLRKKYPNLLEIFEINYDPNTINLFNRLKEEIRNITTFCNGIKLINDYTLQEFESDARRIAKEKYIE